MREPYGVAAEALRGEGVAGEVVVRRGVECERGRRGRESECCRDDRHALHGGKTTTADILTTIDTLLDDAERTATLFRALSDPARVKIVNLLVRSDEPVCVCEFVPAVGLSQPTVSHHLKKLTEAGLLEREERGKWAFYSLSGEALERLASLVEFKEACDDEVRSSCGTRFA